jgi:hypothetical protein
MSAYEAMGCRPTWTCAPYLLPERPGLGEQVAWGESNAIVFANSVLGARTNRYGDFLDICCAITGRAPDTGLHTDAGRTSTLGLEVVVPDGWLENDLLYVAVGLVLGQVAGTEVATITGLDTRADEDRLRARGAAAASSGAVGMFHDPHGDPIPDAPGVVDEPELASLLSAPVGVAVRVVRVDDQSAEFLQLVERRGLMPGSRATVEIRDEAADAVDLRLADGGRLSLGMRAASKILVQPAEAEAAGVGRGERG